MENNNINLELQRRLHKPMSHFNNNLNLQTEFAFEVRNGSFALLVKMFRDDAVKIK